MFKNAILMLWDDLMDAFYRRFSWYCTRAQYKKQCDDFMHIFNKQNSRIKELENIIQTENFKTRITDLSAFVNHKDLK